MRRFGLVLGFMGLIFSAGLAAWAQPIDPGSDRHLIIVGNLAVLPVVDVKIEPRTTSTVRHDARPSGPSALPKLSASQRAPAASRIWEFESG